MLKKLLIISASAIILGVAAGQATKGARACSPGRPDPWFVSELSFDQSTFPAGVTVENNGTSMVNVRNNSSTPLYLIEDFNNGSTFENTELPETVRPLYKLVQGQVYHYEYFSNKYEQYSGAPTSENERVSIDWYELRKYDAGISTEIIAEDNRPADVSVPVDEVFGFSAYSGAQPVLISGVAHFILNPDYDPRAGAKGGEACARFNSTNTAVYYAVLLLIFVVLPLTAIWLIVWGIRRWRKKQVASKASKIPPP